VFPDNLTVQLIDAPGYGFARGAEESWDKLTSKFFSHSPQLFRVISLIDAKVGPTKHDNLLFDMCT
jgi:GTP-binding protein EngB required for normal cell division